ncbi:helix-turn-helix domain-containing protein [Salinibius halmophilus]|uniref:helix-turn-helix domain-containing protein n=1 Tax=Salinibius halmophilus TaxID=1853216 RepID=UPI001314E439|nr:AraC family transcriptional regulator [Salinibius halmophilus]
MTLDQISIIILTILSIGALQSVGLSLNLFIRKHHFLACWIGLFGIEIASKVAMQVDLLRPMSQWLGFWLSLDLFYGPLLYLWVQGLLNGKVNRRQLLHLAPAVLVLLQTLSMVVMLGQNGRADHIATVYETGLWTSIHSWLDYIQPYILYHPFFYSALSLATLLRYRKRFNNHCSESLAVRFDWLVSMLVLQLIMWPTVAYIFNSLPISAPNAWLASYIPAVVWINCLAVISLYHHSVIINRVVIPAPNVEAEKDKNALEKQQIRQIENALLKFKDQGIFKHPRLTLDEMATATNIASHTLSQYLNNELGVNFFDYINSLRIEAVKEALMCDNNQATILQIAMENGFNSKSTFNTVFKKQVGCTPSEYRRKRPNSVINVA